MDSKIKGSVTDSQTSPQNRAKVLLLGSQMQWAGTQKNLLIQALWLHERGYQVTVAFFYDKQEIGAQWRNIYPFPILDLKSWQNNASTLTNLMRLLPGLMRLLRLLAHWHFDVIETFTYHSNLLGIPLAWLAGIPVRIANHRGIMSDLPRGLDRLHTRVINSGLTTCLIAVSEFIRQEAIRGGVHPDKITIIPNSVEIADVNFDIRWRIRNALGIAESKMLVLSVGRLSFEKGHDLFLQAARMILQKQPKTVFALAGDGVLRHDLDRAAKQLGIHDAIRFLGYRQDIPELLAAADIFALTSRTEGMPNALMEAMAMGIAAVAFDVGGVSEVVQNERTGLLAPPEDVAAFANAVIRLISNSAERQRIARAGQEWMRQHHHPDEISQAYINLLLTHLGHPVE